MKLLQTNKLQGISKQQVKWQQQQQQHELHQQDEQQQRQATLFDLTCRVERQRSGIPPGGQWKPNTSRWELERQIGATLKRFFYKPQACCERRKTLLINGNFSNNGQNTIKKYKYFKQNWPREEEIFMELFNTGFDNGLLGGKAL